jgi:dienelactone hydrolase
MADPVETRVEFPSEGETCRGVLVRPAGVEGPLPTVVMAGGWCYTKEIVMLRFARVFAQRGVQALAFDYRNLGESDGERRQHLDPWQQINDYRNAVTYLEGLEGVDADNIGVFGISYSGGHALILAAVEPRAKVVASVVPVIDGYVNMKQGHGSMAFPQFEAALLEDRRARATGKGGTMPMTTPTPSEELATWPYPHVKAIFDVIKAREAPLHEHWNTIESAEMLTNYSVYPFLPRILNVPVLMILAENDNVTMWDLEIDAFNKIPSNRKKLEVLPKTSHMSIYSEETDTNEVGNLAGQWFADQLC